jgi:septum formation protein
MTRSDPHRAPVVLGSQSPRRRELLEQLLGSDRIRVVVPRLTAEPGLSDVQSLVDIDARLLEIARVKFGDVVEQVSHDPGPPCVVAADTVIVGLNDSGQAAALGKPPEKESSYRRTVRDWFTRYYAGRRHFAKTALCVGVPNQRRHEAIVTTEVWFRADAGEYLDWYLSTGEPRGKAGAYAIQEAGSLFVERLTGSLSNVVGLPLVETRRLLKACGVELL